MGWEATMQTYERTHNDAKVYVVCAGHCSTCQPHDGRMMLDFNGLDGKAYYTYGVRTDKQLSQMYVECAGHNISTTRWENDVRVQWAGW